MEHLHAAGDSLNMEQGPEAEDGVGTEEIRGWGRGICPRRGVEAGSEIGGA